MSVLMSVALVKPPGTPRVPTGVLPTSTLSRRGNTQRIVLYQATLSTGNHAKTDVTRILRVTTGVTLRRAGTTAPHPDVWCLYSTPTRGHSASLSVLREVRTTGGATRAGGTVTRCVMRRITAGRTVIVTGTTVVRMRTTTGTTTSARNPAVEREVATTGVTRR